MEFNAWGERVKAVYEAGTEHGWRDEDKAAWTDVEEQMQGEFPHITITWMDPRCGCCTLDAPALLAFDDPRGPDWFELLYPTYRPTHIYHLG